MLRYVVKYRKKGAKTGTKPKSLSMNSMKVG